MLRLTSERAPKPRKTSEQEDFLAFFQRKRAQRTEKPDNPWSLAQVNTRLKFVKDYHEHVIASAVAEFLRDDKKGGLDPPWPLWAFIHDWPQYASRAERRSASPMSFAPAALEQSVVATVLDAETLRVSAAELVDASGLAPEDFEACRPYWSAILALLASSRPADARTVANRCRG